MSEQDFFFDEDEKPTKSEPKKSAPSAKPAASAARSAGSGDIQTVTLTVAVLIGVIGVLLGVVIGLFIGQNMASSAAINTTAAPATTGASSAPQLTTDQLNSGELPAGHPQIGGGTTETSEGTK